MGKTERTTAPSLPRLLGIERFEAMPVDEVVAALGTPRARRAQDARRGGTEGRRRGETGS
jgi:hypothetical protein